jgi:hypothetical protein
MTETSVVTVVVAIGVVDGRAGVLKTALVLETEDDEGISGVLERYLVI